MSAPVPFPAPFSSVGFAGSRSLSGAAWRSARSLAASVAASGAEVYCTCGRGAPAAARAGAPSARVWSVSSGPWSSLPFRARLAVRATAFVRALAQAPAPCLLAWPGCACPAGLGPSASWRSCGSGSWSEVALAAGLGVPVFLFLPAGPPSWWPGSWRRVGSGPLAGAWRFVPAVAQPPLL